MDTEDTGGQWIQGNSRYSGYKRRVDTEDKGGQWIQRIQADSGYRETVDIVELS